MEFKEFVYCVVVEGFLIVVVMIEVIVFCMFDVKVCIVWLVDDVSWVDVN